MDTNQAALTGEEARRRYEAMVALGTASHSPDAWRTMARILHDAARRAVLGQGTALRDRAIDCSRRAVRAAYAASIGAGFRSLDQTPQSAHPARSPVAPNALADREGTSAPTGEVAS